MMNRASRGPDWAFLIMDRLSEPDPDVDHAQAAAQSPHKTVGHNRAKSRIGEQKMIVGPLRPPGNDDQQQPDDGA